jgi:hypothetical protein
MANEPEVLCYADISELVYTYVVILTRRTLLSGARDGQYCLSKVK